MNILHTENLVVAAGGQKLINHLNWQVKQGELWCILGQNGVGKSYLLDILSGFASPLSGKVAIGGMPLTALPVEARARKLGFMAQQQVDTASCTVLATLLRPLGSGRQSDLVEAEAALAAVGLTHKAQMDVLTLSAGERQRLALAALLLQAPALMLLDEPAAHQDAAGQIAMMHFIRGLTANHTIIASCHDIDLAARFATHVLVLAENQHWLGRVEDVLTVEILQQAFDCRFEIKENSGIRSFIPH
jgi:iron complex transport system ATP-binding protein